ncbi:hypothetical protein [uncultured Maribacter sp.]
MHPDNHDICGFGKYAGVVELVDTLDLGLRQVKVEKDSKMQVWWNW